MLLAPKKTREINKFIYVAIPRPSVLFGKYGERSSTGFGTDSETIVSPIGRATTTIMQMVEAQNYFESDKSNE